MYINIVITVWCIVGTQARADSAPPGGQIKHCGDKERSEFPAPWDPGQCRPSGFNTLWTLLLETARAVQRLYGRKPLIYFLCVCNIL